MTRLPAALVAVAVTALATAATAQPMDHAMHGMTMPPAAARPATRPKPAPKRKAPSRPKPGTPAADPHAGHAMPAPASPADAHAGHGMAGMANGAMNPAGTDLTPGTAPAPPPAPGLAADRYWPADAMDRANRALRHEHGGMTWQQVILNLAEYEVGDGRDGYRWDGGGWFGGDLNRLAIKTEGAGAVGGGVDHAEVQALYSRALDPYWNLQVGVRQDIRPRARSHAAIGIEGLAPYWFDVEGTLFLSDRGDLTGRAEAWYDQRLTQFVVVQPRIEFNLSAQAVRRDGLGSGITDAEFGLRLRYERSRRFAPYVGLAWERRFGGTARLARATGADTGGFGVVAGVRTWF